MMVPVSDSISVGDALSLYSHVFCMMVPVSDSIALVYRYDSSGPRIDMLQLFFTNAVMSPMFETHLL